MLTYHIPKGNIVLSRQSVEGIAPGVVLTDEICQGKALPKANALTNDGMPTVFVKNFTATRLQLTCTEFKGNAVAALVGERAVR